MCTYLRPDNNNKPNNNFMDFHRLQNMDSRFPGFPPRRNSIPQPYTMHDGLSLPLLPGDMGMPLQNGPKLLSPILPDQQQQQPPPPPPPPPPAQHQAPLVSTHQLPPHQQHQAPLAPHQLPPHQHHQLKSPDYCHDMLPRYTDMSLARISPTPATQQTTPTTYQLPPTGASLAPPPPQMGTPNCNPVESMLEQITGVNIPTIPGNGLTDGGGSGQLFPGCGPTGLYPVCPPLGPTSLPPSLPIGPHLTPPGGGSMHHPGMPLTPNSALHNHHAHHNAHNMLQGGMAGVGGVVGGPPGVGMGVAGLMARPQLLEPQQADIECDPRELEAFAEHFKQRRIKLSVTQADVGTALADLKLPGVGSLSQSTICRFESLTLSHNNMIALKPVLQSWLEDAERQARQSKLGIDAYGLMAGYPGSIDNRKRKRTSIAAPEKRSLEAYFAIQPRPSGEKIAQIAEKLDLKKNVVRVWFCNQRQKQKRMKFSAVTLQQK